MAENIKKKSSRRQNKDEIFLYILGFLFSFLLFVDVLFSTWKTFCVLFSFSCTQQKRERVMSKKILNVPEERKRCWELTWLSTLLIGFFHFFFGWKDAKVFVKPFFRKNNFYFFTCCDFTFFSFRILRKFVILGIFYL